MLLARGIPDGVVLPRAGQASASLKLGAVLTAVILRKEQQSGHPATSLRSSRGFPNTPQESPGVREREEGTWHSLMATNRVSQKSGGCLCLHGMCWELSAVL